MAHQILTTYFTKFSDFNPDPSAPLLQEFKRLAELRNWNGKKYKAEKSKCLLDEYGLYHATLTLGTRSEQLEKARALCSDLGIEPAPASLTSCKKALLSIHVNIIDLLDARRRRANSPDTTLNTKFQSLNLNNSSASTATTACGKLEGLKVFKSLKQLQTYTHTTVRYFPIGQAKQDGPLRWLLRPLR